MLEACWKKVIELGKVPEAGVHWGHPTDFHVTHEKVYTYVFINVIWLEDQYVYALFSGFPDVVEVGKRTYSVCYKPIHHGRNIL